MPDPTPQELNDLADAGTNAAKALESLQASSTRSMEGLNLLGQSALGVKDVLGDFNKAFTEYGISLGKNSALTQQQVTQFGLLSAAVLGAKNSFDSLHGIDTGNLSTFSDQLSYLNSTFTDTQSGIGKLVSFAKQSFGQMIPQTIIGQGIDAVKAFVGNLARSADNALRVQNAYIQLSARTGNLGEVYKAAGPNLENINSLLEQQVASVNNAVKATGLAPRVIQDYYSQLGAVPKALESTVVSGDNANETISMLTASIKLSTGVGRSYADVIDDLKVAYRDYNLVGENALQFTARISEISNKLGVNLDVVRGSLRGTADVFKMFGNEAEGSARILNNYVGALQKTGISGDLAVDVVSNMTHAIGNLNIAQKSFLSAQTGGPGGLMGGFQIEKMLRDGKIDEVFEKVRKQMQKQFGQIFTLDDATKSPAAAAGLTKQMMMLRQGPLGQFARSDQEAIRILEGFKGKQEGKIQTTDLSSRVVQDSVNKGTAIQEKSYTELSRIRGILEGVKGTADVANLGFVQKGFAASSGQEGVLSEAQRKSKANLVENMTAGAMEGGKIVSNYASQIKNKNAINQSGERMASAISDIYKAFGDIPNSIKSPIDALKQAVASGKPIAKDAEAKLKENIRQSKEEANRKPAGEQREQALEAVRKQENLVKNYSSSNQVGNAALRRTEGNKRPVEQPIAPERRMAKPQEKQEVMVTVTGYCIKCKREIEGSQQAAAVNPVGIR